jgi:hypothetical protein
MSAHTTPLAADLQDRRPLTTRAKAAHHGFWAVSTTGGRNDGRCEMSFSANLWGVMRRAAGNEVALHALIAPGTGEQLIRLHRRFREAVASLEGGLAYRGHVRPGAAARWIVLQGRPAWNRARQDLRGVSPDVPANVPDFGEVIARAYRERFGEEIPTEEPDPADDPSIGYDPVWEERLWELIDVTNVGVPLVDSLEGHTRSDLVRLAHASQQVNGRLCAHFIAALGNDPAVDWETSADWILGMGKDKVEHYMAHPEQFPRSVPLDVKIFPLELGWLYERRYGTPLPWPQ